MLLIPYEKVREVLEEILLGEGFSAPDARYLSEVFAGNTLEGVPSHGVNRFPRFIGSVRGGDVSPRATPETVGALGGLEVWDGHFAAGPLIASAAMARACALAETHGVAFVSVRNSNHWQRAGRYAWQALRKGMVALCWTNTSENMPAWGALDSRLGNNPMALGIPRKKGPVVVDMSMSQYAYGKLEIASQSGARLPFVGGFDTAGNLTDDPGEILKTRRLLPMGMWKGAALSLALDMIAAGVSAGRTAHMIGPASAGEAGLCQAYIAVNYAGVVPEEAAQARFDNAVDALMASVPADGAAPVRYPGQTMGETARGYLQKGIPIHEKTWDAVLKLLPRG